MVCNLLFLHHGGGLCFLPKKHVFLFFQMHEVMTAEIRKCFQTLGLDFHADSGQAKVAYRRLAKRWHPDHLGRHPKNRRLGEERIREINAAYAVVRRFIDSRRMESPALEVPETPRRPGGLRCRQLTRGIILRLKGLLKALLQLDGPGPSSDTGRDRPSFMARRPSTCAEAGGSFEAVLQDLIRERSSHGDSRKR